MAQLVKAKRAENIPVLRGRLVVFDRFMVGNINKCLDNNILNPLIYVFRSQFE